MLSAVQSKMARAALGLGVRDLAQQAGVSPNTIARLEAGERLHNRTLAYIKGAIEALGIEFISPDAVSIQGGEGIRICPHAPSTAMGRFLRRLADTSIRFDDQITAKRKILSLLEEYLAIVDMDSRDLDDWEKVSFHQMIHAYRLTWLNLCINSFVSAIAPPDNRSTEYPIGQDRIDQASEICKGFIRNFISSERGSLS